MKMKKEKNQEKSNKTIEFLIEKSDLITETDGDKTVTDESEGRYEIIEELARGGSGRVLGVMDRHIGRKIAMKELLSDSVKPPSENEDPQKTAMRNRFLREAKLTGRLEHPAIIPVYEIGRHQNGTFYYTMRLIKGKTLLQAIRKCDSLEERLELLPYFYNVCNAVAYSHSKGVINRDLKPSNVMIGEFGETVVLDWGLAKLKGSDEMIFMQYENFGVGETIVGQAIGTPSYMPPEQAEGKIEEIDELSDIYSLGAILYQILTGIPPFSGKSVDEIIRKVLTEKVENATKRNKDIPPELAAIAGKALSKKKKERYAAVGEMLEDLSSYLSGRKVRVYRYSLFESLKFAASRHKAVATSSFIILAVAVIAAIYIMMALNRETKAREEAEHGRMMANYRTAQAFSEKSDKLEAGKSYIASRVYAAAAMYYNPLNKKSPEYNPDFSVNSDEGIDILSSAVSKFYMKNFHRGAVFEKDTFTGCRISAAAASEDGKVIATGCRGGEVTLFSFPDLSRIYKFDLRNAVKEFRFSPDGEKLEVLLSNSEAAEINIVEKTVTASVGKGFEADSAVLEAAKSNLYQKENDFITSAAPCSYGKSLIAGTEKGHIAVFSSETGEISNTLSFRSSPILSISCRSSENLFITASKEGKAVVWDLLKLIPLFAIDGHDSAVVSAFFIGNDFIATAGEEGFLRIWKKYVKKETGLFKSTFSGLRKALLVKGFTAVTQNGENKISIVSKNDGFLSEEYEENFPISDFHVSKDGRFLAVAGKNGILKLYDREKKETKELKTGNEEILSVKISPDSAFVSLSCGEKIRLVRLENFETKTAECGNPALQGLGFAPDGKKLAAICSGEIRFFSIPELIEENKIGIEGRNAQSLEFIRNSNIAVGFDKGTLSHIDTSNNSIIDFRGKLDETAKIAVSEDGLFVATTDENAAVRIWDVNEHKLIFAIPTDKEPACVFFEPEQNLTGICDGENLKFYPIEAPDLNLPAFELLRRMEKEAGMKLNDFYLEIPKSE
ncbi:protein kinase [bacterium]|nr:protein kinase [bacterium]